MSKQIQFIKVTHYDELELKVGQEREISNTMKIRHALLEDNTLGYEICVNEEKVGFILLQEFASKQFFLWNFIVAANYQGQGLGKVILQSLIAKLISEFQAEVITTTYNFGNEIAKKLYERCGFQETEVVHDGKIHEVNMKLEFQ